MHLGAGGCTHASHLTVLRAPVGTLGATFLAVFWTFLVTCRAHSGWEACLSACQAQLPLTRRVPWLFLLSIWL